MIHKPIANNQILRIFRAVLALTVKEAAEKVGCNEKTIRNYEHDKNLPQPKLDYCLSQLGVSVIYTSEHTKYLYGTVSCKIEHKVEEYEPQYA